MKKLDTYLKYGINTELAGKLMRQDLSISKIKKIAIYRSNLYIWS